MARLTFGETVKRYRWPLICAAIIIFLWGWYFLIYARKDLPIEKYSWYKDSEQQLFVKIKNYAESNTLRQGFSFTNYIDDLTYSKWQIKMDEDRTALIAVGETEFEQDVDNYGKTKFKQKMVINANLDTTTKLYVIKYQVTSQYNSPRYNQWMEWDAGNVKQSCTCTNDELNKAVLEVDSQANKLDNFMSGLINKLRSMFRTNGF